MKFEVIIERGDNEFWGRIENTGDFRPTTVADTVPRVIGNLRELIEDYIQHEGQKDEFWEGVKVDQVTFDLRYDLQAFFQDHDYLKITVIAKRAGMNPGLLRQYASGVKYPSADQAKKIEKAIHNLGQDLGRVSLYAV